ncbi:hypothetical protein EPN42_07525 [bacterium]|nr:MAG: hypothetical protein EPN42_07525 [bacterium]
MLRRFLARTAPLALLGVLCAAVPAAADTTFAQALSDQLVPSANNAIKAALHDEHQQQPRVAQASTTAEEQQKHNPVGLPTGWSYSVDVSSALALGNIGTTHRLPGGFDAVVGYGFSPTSRLQGGYYELQEYPVGFNTGSVPLFVQGVANPISSVNLGSAGIDAATKSKFLILLDENLVRIAHKIPVVITPTYIARTASIAGGSDVINVEQNGVPRQILFRTAEVQGLAVTLPFLASPKMFGTITGAPFWLVNRNGANQTNKAQTFALLYLEYRPTNRTTLFVQPSLVPNYLPNDPYPQHLNAVFYGVSHMITKNSWMQLVVETGSPSNYPALGITSITCQQLTPCSGVPTVSGLHATQIRLKFGIGTPSVIPL